MHPFLRRWKFVTERKTVRVAIGIASLIGVGFISIALFYVINNTNEYARTLDDNLHLTLANHGFRDREAFEKFVRSDDLARQNSRELRRIYLIATRMNLTKAKHPDLTELEKFAVEVARPAKPDQTEPLLTEEECDTFSQELVHTVNDLVLAASGLSAATEFETKKRLLVSACITAAPMTSRYSITSYLNRLKAGEYILNELKEFRRSNANQEQKTAIINECIPLLTRPFRFDVVLNKEIVRIIDAYEIVLGNRKYDASSINYRQPKPFPFVQRMIQHMPNVETALRSRTYRSLVQAHQLLAKNPEGSIQSNPFASIGAAALEYQFRLEKESASTDLIRHFSPEIVKPSFASRLDKYSKSIQYLGFQEEY